ncbi:hypothetical protein [Athalassotoga saccharophila]|uniref:hypothetical protein n=1 Tax=Athalassotoga saccharophila TaxID=1441386 RepID=UPI00137AE5C7|nr:hypothetical protein [Athalassotoga saccharophila]BBJ28033.1 hypothetical protein ATHSA_0934 [Athalassotoga saccharophila]
MNCKRSLFIVLLFGIAMGFLESIVVVYLRQIYYSHGFRMHLVIPLNMIHIEMFREIMTIIMIWAVSMLAGENKFRRLYYFIYLFGIWDIFYYVGLKLFLNWPPSILTWDILFLVPTEWFGPVLAPLIVSSTFVIYGLVMILKKVDLDLVQILTGLGGGIIIFLSFVTVDANKLSYNWYIFSVGEGLLLFSMMEIFFKKIRNIERKDENYV